MLKRTFTPDLIARLLKFFVLYFLIYSLISYFIPSKDVPFFSYNTFSQMVVFASLMAMVFVLFDSGTVPNKPGFENDLSRLKLVSNHYLDFTLSAFILFMVTALPLLVIFYFFFTNYRHEVINPWKELVKLLLTAVAMTLLITLAAWIMIKWKQNFSKAK